MVTTAFFNKELMMQAFSMKTGLGGGLLLLPPNKASIHWTRQASHRLLQAWGCSAKQEGPA